MKTFYYLLSYPKCHVALNYHPEVIADVMIGQQGHQCSCCLGMLECEAFNTEEEREIQSEKVRHHEKT